MVQKLSVEQWTRHTLKEHLIGDIAEVSTN